MLILMSLKNNLKQKQTIFLIILWDLKPLCAQKKSKTESPLIAFIIMLKVGI